MVKLEEDLTCTGVECEVDTLSLIKIQDTPPLYYEYMPGPCVNLAFGDNFKKVVNSYSNAMCVHTGVQETVFDSCCPGVPPATPYWKGMLTYAKSLTFCLHWKSS